MRLCITSGVRVTSCLLKAQALPSFYRRPQLLLSPVSHFRNIHLSSHSHAIKMEASSKPAHDFLSFVNASPTPFHAVKSVKDRLAKAGFKEIRERDDWTSTCKPGGKYYLTRNTTTILAFAVGYDWEPGNPVAMIGAHTDSPCLRIKPISKSSSEGYLQVGVETYGGGLWHTWFDRDLSIAGRVMVRTSAGEFHQKLVRIDRPIMRIPTLAIHLERQDDFKFSKETQLFPIAGLVAAELNRQGVSPEEASKEEKPSDDSDFAPLKSMSERHHPYVVELVADEAGVKAEEIVDFELLLYDTQKSCIGGLNSELMLSHRLDNLGMTYCSMEALIESVADENALKEESSIRLISLFDHEEIGSNTAQGADSNLLPAVLRRLSVLPPALRDPADYTTAFEQTLSTSFLISADMAHAVHPNYSGKYEAKHRPEMNKGTVIKINANARYATNSPGIVLVQEAARRAGAPLQLFVVSNVSPCGSTIGPMLSSKLGTRTLDLGNPQLSMHSIRETGGVYDVDHAVKLFVSYFKHFSELERKIIVD